MMGCFSTSHTDGTEEAFRMSLRSLLATKETPIPAPCIAKQIIERKLGLGTRKTLQARTNLLDTACHSLAKAKQRSTLVSLPPSFYIKSDILLFPLPLPPGYKPTNNSRVSAKSSSIASRKLLTAPSSSSSSTKQVDVITTVSKVTSTKFSKKEDAQLRAECTSLSSNSACSPGHSSSSLSFSSEALTPTSPTSSSSSTVFSATTSSLSQSSSFNSSSTTYSDFRSNSLCLQGLEDEDSINSFLNPPLHRAESVREYPLKEFSPMEVAMALKNSNTDSNKLADGAMGPFYKVFLPQEKCSMVITRVATKLSRKKWRAHVQVLAHLAHSNLSKVIGLSYERAKYHGMEGMQRNDNLGFIMYEDIGDESLEDFLQDVEKGIDWTKRLKLAIGIAEGLSFLVENMPSSVGYGDLSLRNVRVDFSLHTKLFDYVVPTTNMGASKVNQVSNLVQSLGNVLLQVFDFVTYPQDGPKYHYKMSYPQKDAEVVIDLATSCLVPEASLQPSIRQVARVLRSIEPTQHVAKHSIRRSKSFTYRRKRSLSFG